MPAELLFEIGCEEIPARFLEPSLMQLREKADKELQKQSISHGEIRTYGTPRRLTLAVYDVADHQEPAREKRTGPLVSQAFDEDGNPTKAAVGFARSCGVEVSNLKKEQTPKGEKLAYTREIPGEPSSNALSKLLPDLVKKLEFPKAMRWGNGDLTFVRPIQWILAILGESLIEFQLDGLSSGNRTCGHRFTHPASVEVSGVADYLETLDRSNVVPDPERRKEIIEKQTERICSARDWEVYPDPELLRETAHLVEYPTVLAGGFDKRFLELPPEVLIAATRTHQKSFSVRKPGTSKELLPHFLTVANNPLTEREDAADIITRGNERVLAARLADAEFYWQEDLKTGLDKMRENTTGMIFYKSLGSYLDKTDRLETLCEHLASGLFPQDREIKEHSKQASRFCKADLVSRMVGEFAELQGIMGREYALAQGKSREVAEAIGEHYLPRSAQDISGDNFPKTDAGVVLSFVDKLDSVVACWAAGLAPTGAGDPFALRRQAQGAINIILAKALHLDLEAALTKAARIIAPQTDADPDKLTAEVMDFMVTRFKVQMTDSGYLHDVVEAAVSAGGSDMLDAFRRIRALAGLKKRDDFEDLMIAFRRVMNIVEGEPGEPEPGMFQDQSESGLFAEFQKVEQAAASSLETGDYSSALETMARLKPAVDKFFDEVMVNVEDEQLRRNRHALCSVIAGFFMKVADFSKVVVEGDRSGHQSKKEGAKTRSTEG